ncbi:hypothetical protein HGRIS_001041 [Hohenbuehelia grisea]|uniref:Uncharacterized protein n=1 Tax=Hohenbuehelia grisea TaxID=104357 RepID=A0ABR3JPF6_9AGAR
MLGLLVKAGDEKIVEVFTTNMDIGHGGFELIGTLLTSQAVDIEGISSKIADENIVLANCILSRLQAEAPDVERPSMDGKDGPQT